MHRFLHTADWQIGRQYGRFHPDDAAALADARFAAVERLAELASQHAVDAVLVAGDIFDAQTVSERTLRRLFLALEGFGGPWLLLPGNHDAALAEGVWATARRLRIIPPQVRVLDQPGVTVFADAGFAVLAAPLTQRQTYTDLTQPFDDWTTPPGLLRIGLAHGSVQGLLADGIDSPNPIARHRAQSANLQYLALGDWHGTREVDPRTWYAGTPEPDRFRNNDAGQALLVELASATALPQVRSVRTGRHSWHDLTFTLQVATDVDAMVAALDTIVAPAVVQVHVRGSVSLADQQRLVQALAQAEARHRSVQADLTQLRLVPSASDLEQLRADGYLADVLAELRDAQQGPDGDVAGTALTLLAQLLREQNAGATSCN